MRNDNIKSVLVYLILSILGGMIGTFIVILYAIKWINIDLTFFPIQENIKNMVSRPQKIVVEQNTLYSKVLEDIKYRIVDVYDFSRKSSHPLSSGIKDLIYSHQFLGKGVILTTDGWIAVYMSDNLSENKEKDESRFAVVLSDKTKIYHPMDIKIDNFSGIVFMKIEATGLDVMPLAETGEINDADEIILVGQDGISIESINNEGYNAIEGDDYVKSSDYLARRILINNDLNKASLVINLQGELTGFMDTNKTAFAAAFIDKAFKSILKHQEVVRPYLGIEYIDLSTILKVSDEEVVTNRGLVVYKVKPNGAAADSGIKENDMILKVENEEVKDDNLPELIQEYEQGTAVNFTILRNGEELVLQVVLK